MKLLGQLEELCLRQVIETLTKTIQHRETQEDYWPEGRLNAGIAYAILGDYQVARRWLEEAVDIFAGSDLVEDGRAMAV